MDKVSDVIVKIRKKHGTPKIVHVDRLKRIIGPVDLRWYNGTPTDKPPAQSQPKDNEPLTTVFQEMGLSAG